MATITDAIKTIYLSPHLFSMIFYFNFNYLKCNFNMIVYSFNVFFVNSAGFRST